MLTRTTTTGPFSGIERESTRSDKVSENLLTPEGEMMLERLGRLQRDDLAQQTKYFPGSPPKDDPDPNVMQQRCEHRRVCAKLFEELISRTELPTDPPSPVSQYQQLDQQNALERWKWLDRFEKEVIIDRNFLEDYNGSSRVYTRAIRESQITSWMNEVNCRQERWLRAIKLVLELKADEQIRREARAACLMDRVSSLIPELMLKVVKACVKSQFGHWSVQQSTVLSELADKCFRWPGGVTDDTRNTLKLEAANALIKTSIVKIQMELCAQNTIVVPPLLVGRQNDLRRLALDLHNTPVDGRYNRELNKGIKVIPSLGTLFPNMEAFVLSLYFRCRTRADNPSFKLEILTMLNLKRTNAGPGWQHTTMKETTIDLVQAFARSAPRARKLIRFGHMTADDYRLGDVGPLVEVGTAGTQTGLPYVSEREVDDRTMREENSLRTDAKSIFDRAYCAPRVVRESRAGSSDSKRSTC